LIYFYEENLIKYGKNVVFYHILAENICALLMQMFKIHELLTNIGLCSLEMLNVYKTCTKEMHIPSIMAKY